MPMTRSRFTHSLLMPFLTVLVACGGGKVAPDDGDHTLPDAGEIPSDTDSDSEDPSEPGDEDDDPSDPAPGDGDPMDPGLGDDDPTDPEEPEPGEVVESHQVTVGRDGKQVTLDDGSSFSIPENALAEPVELTISRTLMPSAPAVSPSGVRMASDEGDHSISYMIEPLGIGFLLPVTVSLALPKGAADAEGWAVAYSPDPAMPPLSLGRRSDRERVVADITSTGMLTVKEDDGTRSVLGTAKRIHLLPDGSITQTRMPFADALKLSFRGSDGVRHERIEEIQADGTFRFNDIPSGVYQLQFHWLSEGQPDKMEIIETDVSVIDLGNTTQLRPDATPASPGTALSIEVDSPTSPSPSDLFFLGANSAGQWSTIRWIIEEGANGPILPVARLTGGNLLDRSAGDVLTVSRMQTRQSSSGQSYRGAVDRAYVDTIIQTDGEEATVIVELEPYPHSRELDFTLQTPDFFVDSGLAGESSCLPSIHATVEAYPEHEELMPTTEVAGLYQPLLMYQGSPEEELFSPGLMSFGSDSIDPRSEVLSVYSVSYAFTDLVLTGTTSGPPRMCSYNGRGGIPLSEASNSPLSPGLSPPRALLVNGLPADTPINGLPAAALELEWEAPLLGTPSAYLVVLFRLEAQAEKTVAAASNSLRTQATRIVIPPELILPGASYYIRVVAYSGPEGSSRPETSLRSPLRFPVGLSTSFAESRIIQIAH